jgi:transcriptional regulator with PAS, ATPase and Fis domain
MAPLDVAVDRLLPALIERLYERSDAADLARWAGSALYQLLTLRGLEIEDERGGVLFSSGQLRESEAVTESRRGRIAVRATSARRSGRGTLAQLVDSLAAAVALASERERPLPRPQEAPKPPELPGAGSVEPTVLEIFERAQRVAPGEVGVLILGESGTGKEVLARYIHDASGRERWVALNCAALPRDLLEAELFGVEKGTATGVEARPGKLELADGGTLFLDEIGDMSLETQAKILRVLQEGEVYRLGASQPRPARARVLSATNQDLRQLLSEGRFRLDLYHRIAGWVVELPPLRERTGDIPGLAGLFLAEEGRKLGRRFRGISRGALDTLLACPWPGNIRQLRQEVARCALFMEEGSVLEATLLGPEIREETAETTTQAPLADRLQAYERREIERTLAACGGQVSRAAEVLGMHRASLYRRMKTLGIDGSG